MLQWKSEGGCEAVGLNGGGDPVLQDFDSVKIRFFILKSKKPPFLEYENYEYLKARQCFSWVSYFLSWKMTYKSC